MIVYALFGVAALLVLAPVAVALGARRARRAVYGVSLVVTLMLGVIGVASLFGFVYGATSVTLPLGLPWLGAHFRIDALSAFFLVVVNLGGATRASTRSATGATRRHRNACCRSIPPISPP